MGKLELKDSFDRLAGFLTDNDIELLPITFEHLQRLLHPPPSHKDPFDRIIIAQALTESLAIATKDAAFSDYDVA